MKLTNENMIKYLSENNIYHGSREGLIGDIKPNSRPNCDFGAGFYMGTNAEQTKGLIASYPAPIAYTVKINIARIPQNRILTLTGQSWLNTVLGFRSENPELRNCPQIKRAMKAAQNADIVIGPIADDRMVKAFQQFEQGGMTDKALLACLRDVDYGVQIVAKTKAACESIQIVEQHELDIIEKRSALEYNEDKRSKGNRSIENAIRQYRRDGLYIDEFIKNGYAREQKAQALSEKIAANEMGDLEDDSITGKHS